MKILIFVVNYKADDKLIRFCKSVKVAMNNSKNVIVDLIIKDNSIKSNEELVKLEKKIKKILNNISIYSDGTNKGYFAGIQLAQSILKDKKDYDCLIYCNPDIILDKNFFKQLDFYQNKKCIIAPSIISLEDNFDQNPLYISRLSKKKLKLLKFIYSNLVTFNIYQGLGRIKEIFYKKKKFTNISNKSKIYAPHGAIFIFTDIDFFLKLPKYKGFLFGEEIFIAEEAIKYNQDIIYDRNIKVYDERHASINLLSSNKLRKYYYESIKFLLKEYY